MPKCLVAHAHNKKIGASTLLVRCWDLLCRIHCNESCNKQLTNFKVLFAQKYLSHHFQVIPFVQTFYSRKVVVYKHDALESFSKKTQTYFQTVEIFSCTTLIMGLNHIICMHLKTCLGRKQAQFF